MGKTQLAPGFRFYPTDVELVRYYLRRKVMGKKHQVNAIAEVDIYRFEPSDLPDKSYLRTGDRKWYFFCPREKKYASGSRLNRATVSGYWKTTGKDRDVLYNNEVVGKIKTLVYHQGRSPRGERTDWVMHEYRLEDKELSEMNVVQDAYVLCIVFKKDGPGPKNGAQYGAPFKEDDWSDEDEDTDNIVAIDSPVNLPGPSKQISLVATCSHAPKDFCTGLVSESCLSDTTPTASKLPPLNDAENTPMSAVPTDANKTPTSAEFPQTPGDNISALLDVFVDDESLPFSGCHQNEVTHESNLCGIGEASLCLEGDDIFCGLGDLSNLDDVPTTASYGLFEGYNCNPTEDTQFLELQDLAVPLTAPAVQAGNPGNNGSDCLIPGRFGFPTDPSSFVTMGHGTESSQSQLQRSQPHSGYLEAFGRRYM